MYTFPIERTCAMSENCSASELFLHQYHKIRLVPWNYGYMRNTTANCTSPWPYAVASTQYPANFTGTDEPVQDFDTPVHTCGFDDR
jgi:hypothetical protein